MKVKACVRLHIDTVGESGGSANSQLRLKSSFGKILGTLEGEILETDEPPVSKRTVCHVGHAQLASCVNETVCLMHGLEGRVLGLDGINLCDWK